MGQVFILSRHAGTVEWLARQNISGTTVAHLDASTLARGDEVIGNLPAHIIADLCTRGVRYTHLAIDPPPELRGREFSADDLEAFGARLMPLNVIHAPEPPPKTRRVATQSPVTLITFLGAPRNGDYEAYDYAVDEQVQTSRWMPEAFVAARSIAPGAVRRVVIIGARGSSWDLLARVAGLSGSDKEFELFSRASEERVAADSLSLIEARLAEKLGVDEVEAIVAPYASDTDSSILVTTLLAQCLRPGERVVLDVTFGLRDIMLTFFSGLIAMETLRDVKLVDVIYAAVKTQEPGKAVVHSIGAVRAMMDWVRALSRMDATGDIEGLAALLQSGTGQLGALLLRQDIEESLLQPRVAAERARQVLALVKSSKDPLVMLFRPAIRERLSWALNVESLSDIQAALARRSLKDHDWVRATALAFEACISRALEDAGLDAEVAVGNARMDIQNVVNQHMADLRASERTQADKDYRLLKSVRNALLHMSQPGSDEVKAILRDPQKLSGLIERTLTAWIG